MSEDTEILNTIEVLTNKVRAKEDEANKLKKLVNELCGEAGLAPRYANVSESGASVSAIRSDQFYGHTLTAAIRNYLELRKSSNLGAASVTEIYRAIKDGGYKFGTNNEENAKTSLGNALRKSSSIFHRLPNGQYGLLTWYPNAKAPAENGTAESPKRGRGRPSKKQAGSKTPILIISNGVTNQEIRDVILSQPGEFQAANIEGIVKDKYPSKILPKTKIPAVLFLLKNKGLVKIVSERSGKRGAVWSKA